MSFEKIKPYIPGRHLYAYLEGEYGADAGMGKCIAAIVADAFLYVPLAIGFASLIGCNLNSQTPKKNPSVVTVPWKGSHTDSGSGIGVALGDVDGDRLNDLIVGHPSEVKVFLNKDGVFEELKE